MSFIFEVPESRPFTVDGTNTTYKREFKLREYATESDAINALVAAAPASISIYGILLADVSYSIKPLERFGDYIGTVSYKHTSKNKDKEDPQAAGDEKLTFSFVGGSTFFTKAIAQTKYSGDAATTSAKDVGTALNVLPDGEVEGIDVGIPGSGFQVQTVQNIGTTATAINNWLKDRIAQIHTTNDDTFRGLETRDCLLLGFSGEKRSDDLFDITYDFSVQIGEDYTSDKFDTGLVEFTVGARIPGFEVVWVMYEPEEDTTNKLVRPRARGLYVAQVFEDSDFSELGITT